MLYISISNAGLLRWALIRLPVGNLAKEISPAYVAYDEKIE